MMRLDSPRNAVMFPFSCENCNYQVGGRMFRANSPRELFALRWLAEASALRQGHIQPSIAACVLSIGAANSRIIAELCEFVYAYACDKISPILDLFQWVNNVDRDAEMREELKGILQAGHLGRNPMDAFSALSARVMATSAQAFVDSFFAAKRNRLKRGSKDVIDIRSRAMLIASQYARRATADAWMRCLIACDVTPENGVARFIEMIRRILSGPVWMLGRYSGVQAILGHLGDNLEIADATRRTLDASQHIVVVRRSFSGADDLSFATVCDGDLLSAVAQALTQG